MHKAYATQKYSELFPKIFILNNVCMAYIILY